MYIVLILCIILAAVLTTTSLYNLRMISRGEYGYLEFNRGLRGTLRKCGVREDLLEFTNGFVHVTPGAFVALFASEVGMFATAFMFLTFVVISVISCYMEKKASSRL